MTWALDFASGVIRGDVVHVRRAARDLESLFVAPPPDSEAIVYETYSQAAASDAIAELLVATTVLYPGKIGDEPFMTRGHFHTRADRGEFVLTLAGSGELRLKNHNGETRVEPMVPGSIHQVDGAWAHRVVNMGTEALRFLVTWMSDCGHDYASIEAWGPGGW